MVVYVFLMDESDKDEKTVYIQKGKYSCKLNSEEPTSDFQFKVRNVFVNFRFNKMELLQSQASAERELLGNSADRTLDIGV